MFSLHANGCARLIFFPDQNPLIEGVLITEDTDETFGIVGKVANPENPTLLDINVTDGETGQLYIVRRVQLKTLDCDSGKDGDGDKANVQPQAAPPTDEADAIDTGLEPGALSKTPNYELYSDVLKFSTDEILVGNRADKDISTYLNPEWVGKKMKIHMGPMSIHFSTAVTPPPTPAIEEKRQHHLSICGNGTEGDDGQNVDNSEKITDADVNFLM